MPEPPIKRPEGTGDPEPEQDADAGHRGGVLRLTSIKRKTGSEVTTESAQARVCTAQN